MNELLERLEAKFNKLFGRGKTAPDSSLDVSDGAVAVGGYGVETPILDKAIGVESGAGPHKSGGKLGKGAGNTHPDNAKDLLDEINNAARAYAQSGDNAGMNGLIDKIGNLGGQQTRQALRIIDVAQGVYKFPNSIHGGRSFNIATETDAKLLRAAQNQLQIEHNRGVGSPLRPYIKEQLDMVKERLAELD